MRRACNPHNTLNKLQNQKSKLSFRSAARGLLIFKLDFSTQIFVPVYIGFFWGESCLGRGRGARKLYTSIGYVRLGFTLLNPAPPI